MKVISFGGGQEVGKNTCAKYMRTYLAARTKGQNIATAGFADKIKEIAYDLYGWADLKPGWFYEEDKGRSLKNVCLPRIGKSPRQIWIDLGNSIRDFVYEPTWAHRLLYGTVADYLLITDLRFPTEARYIRDFGGFLVRVDRASAPKVVDGCDEMMNEWKDWDFVINNDGDHDYLYRQVENVSRQIFTEVEFSTTTTLK